MKRIFDFTLSLFLLVIFGVPMLKKRGRQLPLIPITYVRFNSVLETFEFCHFEER